PVPVAQWGLREVSLAGSLPVFPATTEGLLALGNYLDLQLIGEIDGKRGKGEPSPDHLLANLEALRAHLGEEAFQWLCACAVYPELHWNLTLYLATLPCMDDGLISEANLLRLVRLPWFRAGSIPDDLRSRLIQKLDNRKEKAVREAIIKL